MNPTVDLAAAAAFLGIHPDTLRERAAAGTVRGAKVGRGWRFLESDLANTLHQEKVMTYVDDGRVYFVEEDERSAVKIGFSSKACHLRLIDLQVGNPRKLRIARTFRGTFLLEQMTHRLLAKHRLCGEWFTRGDEVRSLLAAPGDDMADALKLVFKSCF